MPSNSVEGLLWGMPSPLFQSSQKSFLSWSWLILIALAWPRQCWFSDLLSLSVRPLIFLPLHPNLLTQHHSWVLQQAVNTVHFMVWMWHDYLKRRNNVWKLFNPCCLTVGSPLRGWLIWPGGSNFQFGFLLRRFSWCWPALRTFWNTYCAFSFLISWSVHWGFT